MIEDGSSKPTTQQEAMQKGTKQGVGTLKAMGWTYSWRCRQKNLLVV